MTGTDNDHVIIIGAGMVGIACAVHLRRSGLQVTLLDREGPGAETSSGNAGVIACNYLMPLAKPALRKRFPSLFMNRDPRFLLRHSHLHLLAPWLMRFAANCTRSKMNTSVRAMSSLLATALADHREMMAWSDSLHLLNDHGWLRLYLDRKSFAEFDKEREIYDRHGIDYRVLAREQYLELEPDLTTRHRFGVWLPGSPSVVNPQELCRRYAGHFSQLGGHFTRGEAKAVRPSASGWQVLTGQESLQGKHVVVALGAWSAGLPGLNGFGNHIALDRGYHLMFETAPGIRLRRSTIDLNHGFVMTPMDAGIRVTSATNLVGRECPPTPVQLQRLLPQIRESLPMARQLGETPWMGNRPSTPDSLPVIGPAPGQPGLWYACGHGHLGLTLGPTTGKLIARAIRGESPDRDITPFLPGRFRRMGSAPR